mgnify:CR=1 FL=1
MKTYLFSQYITEASWQGVRLNIPLLIIIFAVLILALVICIHISKKNKLYINPDRHESPKKLNQEKRWLIETGK